MDSASRGLVPRATSRAAGAASEPEAVRENLDRLMERYQQADPEATIALVRSLSPVLLRFFQSQPGCRDQANDLLQETWLRIHRCRHSFRPGEPVLPWAYAIARRVRVDGFRRYRRVMVHEIAADILPEGVAKLAPRDPVCSFDSLVASLPEAQREVVIMLKVGGLSVAEVARATSSTIGAVKQKAHRAYSRLRLLLQTPVEGRPGRGIGE